MLRKIGDPVARILVGGLFIFSGLIKLNDPIGTGIKMEEYFEVFAIENMSDLWTNFVLATPSYMEGIGVLLWVFYWIVFLLKSIFFSLVFLMKLVSPFLFPFSLEVGFVMVVLEVVLGIAILLYWRMNLTSWILLLLMMFFTLLTFYSAYFNKVTDCGCFGDAIPLTPWQSFSKDVFLMVFVLHLFWYRKKYEAVLRTRSGYAAIGSVTVVCFFLGIYALRHLPFIDFRPYKIGNSIPEQMQPREAPIIEYVFEKDGKEVRSKKFLSEQDGYKYLNSEVLNLKKTVPKITDFSVSSIDGEDVTQNTFEGAKLLFIMYNVAETSSSNIDQLRDLAKNLDGKVEIMVLTSSSSEEIEAFRHEHQLAVPYYFSDATVLKTIIRSNPGITLWVNGTVKGMWHHNDTPDAGDVIKLASTL